jgi:hypothetical protein
MQLQSSNFNQQFLALLVFQQQVRKVATFFWSIFLVKKFRRAANTIQKQLLIEN